MKSAMEHRSKFVQGPPFERKLDNISLGQIFFSNAEKYKDKICQLSTDDDRAESYASVKLRSSRMALDLEKNGISAKDVIAVCSDNTMDNVVPMIAAMYIGAKAVNIAYTPDFLKIRRQLTVVTPAVIFVDENVMAVAKEALKETGLRTEVHLLGQQLKPYKDENTFVPSKVDVHETAMMFFSSGTAGQQRVICHSHYTLLKIVQAVWNSDLITTSVLHFATFCWLPVMVIVICCFLNGSTRVFCRDVDEGVLAHIERSSLSCVFLSPPQALELTRLAVAGEYNLSCVQYAVVTGSQMPATLSTSVRSFFPNAQVLHIYGVAEVGLITCFNPVRDAGLLKAKACSCGKVVPEAKIRVANLSNGTTQGAGGLGELRVKSPGLMKGYHCFDCTDFFDGEGYLKTGDVGYYDSDECFYVVDRVREVFMSAKGQVIIPSVLEAVLQSHPRVKEAGVFPLPASNDTRGDLPAACVVLKENAVVSELELEEFVGMRVSPAERLTGGVKVVAALPKTAVGRVKRRELKAIFLETQQGAAKESVDSM